jgi:hypothetical protein
MPRRNQQTKSRAPWKRSPEWKLQLSPVIILSANA